MFPQRNGPEGMSSLQGPVAPGGGSGFPNPLPPLWTPPRPESVVSASPVLQQAPLTPQEVATFDADIRRIGAMQALERDLTDLLLVDEMAHLYALSVAKAQIGTNPRFAGVTAHGNEIGMQLIRAVTVVNPGIAAGGTPVLVWDKTYGAAGWNDTFGSAANPVDLSQSGSSGASATNEQSRVMLSFGALVNDQVPSLLAEYRFHLGQLDFGVQTVSWIPVSDLAYARLFRVVVVPPNTKFYMRGNISASGKDGTQLYGVAFATGDYLQQET